MSRTLHMPHTADMSRFYVKNCVYVTSSVHAVASPRMYIDYIGLSCVLQCVAVCCSVLQCVAVCCTLITLLPVAVITYFTIPVLTQCMCMHLHGSGYLYVTNCLCHMNLYDLDVSMHLSTGGVENVAYNIC